MDYCEVIVTLASEAGKYDDDTALVFIGQGTSHYASACYPALDYMLKEKGFSNIYMGTVQGYPSCDTVKRYIGTNYKKIILYPFMIANGEYSYTDIAGDSSTSWKMSLRKAGYETKFVLKGLGEYNQIGRIFAEHAVESMVKK
jgi:sirohydrochlorin cobaltochelatase